MFALNIHTEKLVPYLPSKKMKCFRNYIPVLSAENLPARKMSWSEIIRKMTYAYINTTNFFRTYSLQNTENSKMLVKDGVVINM